MKLGFESDMVVYEGDLRLNAANQQSYTRVRAREKVTMLMVIYGVL